MNRVVLLFLFLLNMIAAFPQQYTEVKTDHDKTEFVSAYSASVTHTQNSPDSWKNAQAVAAAKVLLENSTEFQNQHIMGWGCLNPWVDSTVTNPALWDWRTLDSRINLIRETKGKVIITLCGAPTWMHSPDRNGFTDWGTSLEKAPTPPHFDDFAHLCAEVARRYPDVVYYQVWNELKGFWNMELNRWRYEDYTRMYNMIYDSLKKVNPGIKAGGPYPVVSTYSVQKSFTSTLGGVYGYYDKRPLDVIEYWLQHKHGADFLAVDGKLRNKDEILNCDVFLAGDKYFDIVTWIRQKEGTANKLDIWWSEWYVHPGVNDPQNDQEFDNALMASTLIKTIKAGSANVLIWQPEGDEQGSSFPLGIWTSTAIATGGKPTPFYNTSKILKEHFSRGTAIVHSETASNDINILASTEKILLVNHRNRVIDVRINNQVVISLIPYEVRLIDAVPPEVPVSEGVKISYNSFSGTLDVKNLSPQPEIMRYSIFNTLGALIRSGEENVISEHSIKLEMLPSGGYIYRISYLSNLYNRLFIRSR